MKARVLIVEDDAEIAELIRLYLERDGMSTVIAPDAETGLGILANQCPEVALLDINLPGMDGFEFLRELRKRTSIPVLIVSAREDDADLVLGLGLGADDFIIKPFSPSVLTARVRAHLRRASIRGDDWTVSFGQFSLNLDAQVLKREGERIALPAREMDLLAYLARHPEKTFSPEELYGAVWGNSYGDITTVAVHIQRLRKKIEENPAQPRYVRTVRGRGYSFVPEDAQP